MSPGGVRVGVMGEALSGGVHFKGNLMVRNYLDV